LIAYNILLLLFNKTKNMSPVFWIRNNIAEIVDKRKSSDVNKLTI